MKKIYIWGAGKCFDIVYETLNQELCVVIGVVDSNKNKQGKIIGNGFTVASPEVLLHTNYDYILISVRNYEAIIDKCQEMKIDTATIITFWKSEYELPYFNYVKTIWDLKRKLDLYKCRWENLPYELGIESSPEIRSAEELLNIIIKRKSSLCRYGDGEFEIMRGIDRPWFQEVNEVLASRLREVVRSNHRDIIIAVANNFGSLESYTEEAADIIRNYLGNGTRNEVMKFLDLKRTYFDAYVSRPYVMYKDKNHAKKIFDLFKKIWHNRNLLIVEGEYSRIGVRNDLFAGTKSIRRILCPHKNAFGKYKNILHVVQKSVIKDELVIISLGPTATVLAYDLAKEGIQALDIGQMDNEYEWYLRKANNRIEIPGKGVAELNWCHEPKDIFWDSNYEGQIIARIGNSLKD